MNTRVASVRVCSSRAPDAFKDRIIMAVAANQTGIQRIVC
jgi:hypothetical protein